MGSHWCCSPEILRRPASGSGFVAGTLSGRPRDRRYLPSTTQTRVESPTVQVAETVVGEIRRVLQRRARTGDHNERGPVLPPHDGDVLAPFIGYRRRVGPETVRNGAPV